MQGAQLQGAKHLKKRWEFTTTLKNVSRSRVTFSTNGYIVQSGKWFELNLFLC